MKNIIKNKNIKYLFAGAILLTNLNMKSYFINTIIFENRPMSKKVILYGDLSNKNSLDITQNQISLIDQKIDGLKKSNAKIKLINLTEKYFKSEKPENNNVNIIKKIKTHIETQNYIKKLDTLNKQRSNKLKELNKNILDLESAFDDLSLFTSLEIIDPNININNRIKIEFNKKKLAEDLVKIENQIKETENNFLEKFNLKLSQSVEFFMKTNFMNNIDLINEKKRIINEQIKILKKLSQNEKLNENLIAIIKEKIEYLSNILNTKNIENLVDESKQLELINTIIEISKKDITEKILIFADHNQISEISKILLLQNFDLTYNSGINLKFDSNEFIKLNPLIINFKDLINNIEKIILNTDLKNIIKPIENLDFEFINFK